MTTHNYECHGAGCRWRGRSCRSLVLARWHAYRHWLRAHRKPGEPRHLLGFIRWAFKGESR